MFVFILLVLLGLEYYSQQYDLFFARLLENKQDYSTQKYPLSFNDLKQIWNLKYKLIAAPLYFVLHILLGIWLVWTLFPKKSTLINVSLVYAILVFVIFLFIITGLVFHSYSSGFGAAQNVKIIINSPIIPLLMILYYWKIKPMAS